MKIINTMVYVLASTVLTSCGYRIKEAPRKKMTGINGEAVYVFNKGDTIATVYKQEYFGPDFQVFINEDSIDLGSYFVAHLNVPKPNYEIAIASPRHEVIKKDNVIGERDYRYKPDSVGVYEFRGIIKYDSASIPFKYKFIVIDK